MQEPFGIGLKTYYRGRVTLNFFHLMYQVTPNVNAVAVGELRDKFIPRALQGNNDYLEYFDKKCPFNLSDISNFPSYWVFHTLLSIYNKNEYKVVDEHFMNERARNLCEILTNKNYREWLTNL